MTSTHHLKGGIALPLEKVAELYHSYKEILLKKTHKERDHHPMSFLEELITPPPASRSEGKLV